MFNALNELANNPLHSGIGMFAGMRVIETAEAMTETTERLFPVSRHRSARIRKKLIKRFGGEFVKKPAAYCSPSGNTLYVHPVLYAELKRQVAEVS